jgi:lipooligosaccharide transport system ATP-binding protein
LVVHPGVTTPAVQLTDVVKAFGDLVAVDHLNLTVSPGTCLGLLGPNGAGKSTTMRLLTAQAIADSGNITVLGWSVPKQSKQARARMGVVPQRDNLDEQLACAANLLAYAALYRIPRSERRAAVQRALVTAGLENRANTTVEKLSGGMRRRLLIARGLIHNPDLVLLDEPTVGLDPQVRAELWSVVDQLRNSGVTIVMSTHYIEEAELLSDDVAIMSHGRVIAQGPPHELLALHAGNQAAEYYGPPDRLTDIEQRAHEHGLITRRSGPCVSVLRSEAAPSDILTSLGDPAFRPATLEDVFVLLTGEVLD